MKFHYIEKLVIISLLVLGISSCGSSDGVRFISISGRWSGMLIQASEINCSDGSFLGVGVGTSTGENISIEISGGDSTDEEAALFIDECIYSGVRTEQSEIEFFSSDNSCADSVLLTEIEFQSALAYFKSRPPLAAPNGDVICTADFSAEISLDS